jgi:hypothetical protein
MTRKELRSCFFIVVINALIYKTMAVYPEGEPIPNYADSEYDENGLAWGIDRPTPF